MAETTLLKTSAIVRNATFTPPQHGPVKTGALPLVQVRMTPAGPQIQEGQQKPVEILPPRDAKSAVATGGLPMIQVKMTQNGPQIDDGRDQAVVIKDARPTGVATGHLPMVQVKMTNSGPQVQTLPNVAGGPPQIPAALPALSAPRGGRAASPGRQVVAAPRQVPLPLVPELPTDQLMLCRHLVDKYLGESRAAVGPVAEISIGAEDVELAELADASVAETSIGSENIKLAERTIRALDEALVATAVREEEAAAAAAAAAVAVAPRTVAVPTAAAYSAATSIAPAPSASYVAGRVNARPQTFTGGRVQRDSGLAPRRVARPASGSPLPPVIVKMDGRQPIVLNRAEIDQARNSAPSPESTASVGSSEDPAGG